MFWVSCPASSFWPVAPWPVHARMRLRLVLRHRSRFRGTVDAIDLSGHPLEPVLVSQLSSAIVMSNIAPKLCYVAVALFFVVVYRRFESDVHPDVRVSPLSYDKTYHATVIVKNSEQAVILFPGGNHVPIAWEQDACEGNARYALDSRGGEWLVEFSALDNGLRGITFLLAATSVIVALYQVSTIRFRR